MEYSPYTEFKPLTNSPCCKSEMKFRYASEDGTGEALVCCVCKRCGKHGAWYNIPLSDEEFWHGSAHDFASLYWNVDLFGKAIMTSWL